MSYTILQVDTDTLQIGDITTPETFEQATSSRQSKEWWASMKKEITDLMIHKTWEPILRDKVPKKHKITKSRWVYAIKTKRDGTIERFKSRFVVCGYSQVMGVDYTQSFSATLRATSMRTLLAMAAGEKLKLEHFDVTSAFTQSKIDCDIYVEPPKGFVPKIDGKPTVLKLLKALYGTKQASKLWQDTLAKHLTENMGFKRSTADPCLFSRRDECGSVILVGIYVDDIICAHNEKKFEWFKTEFSGPNGFRSNHLGPLSWFLGIAVDQAPDFSVSLNQKQYIKKLIEKFIPNYESSIKHSMPCNPITFQKLNTAKTDEEKDKASKFPYLQLIGSLLYLSTMTRPDIAYHMSILCSFMHNPSVDCYKAALDLLLYVANTMDQKLTFSGKTEIPTGLNPQVHEQIRKNRGLLAYSDASWHKPDELGFNMFGFVVYFMGGPISFSSKNLKVVALSSAEAEYAAAAYTCKELTFVRNIVQDLGHQLDGPIVIGVDNKAAIKICENVGVTGRNKHFTDSIHYFRYSYTHKNVFPQRLP